MLKKKINKFVFLLVFLLPSLGYAQELPPGFEGEFRGLEGTITYTTDEGEVVTEDCINVIGRFSRTMQSVRLVESFADPGASASRIPTACLAREHWWMSFELLMKAQREYAECVAGIKENQIRLGMTCLIDQPCHPLFFRVMVIKEYWVPHSIVVNNVDKSKPPRREDYITHFIAGIVSLTQVQDDTVACKAGLDFLRTQ